RRAVIAAASDAAYTTAAALREAGMDVVAIVERRAQAAASTAARGIRIMMGAAVTGVIGRRAVRGCHVQLSAGSRAAGARSERLDCDLILTAGGFAPAGPPPFPARGPLARAPAGGAVASRWGAPR